MYTIWKQFYRNLLFLVTVFFFAGCLAGCNRIEIIKIKVAVKHNVGKTIDLSMNMTDLLTDSVIEAREALRTPITIVSQVSRDICPECLGKYLHVAEKYVSQFNSDSISFVAIINDESTKPSKKHLEDLDPHKIRVLFDEEDRYLKEEHLMSIKKMWNVFLLDDQQKILLMGDPITQTNTKPFYTQYINDWLKGAYSSDY